MAAPEALRTWHALDEVIMTLDGQEVRRLLDQERHGQRRLRMMLRLYNRVSRLRREREVAELVTIATDGMRKRARKARGG